ncbi:kynurenine/alpha-aminoadipate aminotransferase, mitochondrial-like isoform X2 [Liolophura sinensis]|uniref:kynurenine/alpha-aminoadipate aminotransferase, mitochondrial-like isoform X2 n=1 Tax=Liolophura sinensis TaxID=3198878 RepID=UPI0031582FCA
MNYDRFFSDLGRSRQPSFLRQLYEDGTAAQKEPMDHLISLSGGIPSADTFPVKTISFELSDGKTVTLDEKTTAKCLQYGKSTGIEDLLGWLERILVKFHNPKLLHPQTTPSNGSRTKIVMTNGCQDAISKLFGALCSKGDTVLIEESVYAGCLAALRPHGVRMQTVKSTQGGIDVEDLERVLSKWSPKDVQNETSDSPKLMYVVPTGSNPTGQNLSLESKRKIYSLAQKYDFLIMEDDPYYFHNFEETAPPSFLSLDTDGRVIRLDSFSKIISPGMRLGFVSGPEAILNVLLYDIQSSGVHGNHLSQMMVLGLMENWGMEGFQKHVEKLCKTYKNRRDMCVRAAETHLKGFIPSCRGYSRRTRY